MELSRVVQVNSFDCNHSLSCQTYEEDLASGNPTVPHLFRDLFKSFQSGTAESFNCLAN